MLLSLISGLLTNVAFIGNPLAQVVILATFATPMLYVYNNNLIRGFIASFLFAAAWMIPQSIWYFNIMSDGVAAIRIFGNVMLVVLALTMGKLLFVKSKWVYIAITAITFTLIDGLFSYLPFSEGWVIPTLAHAQYLNPTALMIASLFTTTGVVFAVIMMNGAFMYLQGHYACILTALLMISTTLDSPTTDKNFITIESPEYSVEAMIAATDVELKKVDATKETYVVWPENKLSKSEQHKIEAYTKENGITVAYNSRVDSTSYLTIIEKGAELLSNNKLTVAPGENSIAGTDPYVTVNGLSGVICYDILYDTVSFKVPRDTEILFVPINDERFGEQFKRIHVAMMAYRSVEMDTIVVSAGRTGPSVVIVDGKIVK